MGSRFAAALLVVIGVLHLGTLIALIVTRNTRPLTGGDIAFLTGAGALSLMAAVGVAKQRRWGRWLGLTVSGVEAVPATVLLYTLVVFSADPSNRASLAQLAFMAALLAPLAVFIALWFHKPPDASPYNPD